MVSKVSNKGIYLTVMGWFLLALNWLSFGYWLSWLAKRSNRFSYSAAEIKKANAWIIEGYQVFILSLLIFALWNMPYAQTEWPTFYWVAFFLAHYRPAEIAVYSVKWLLVDEVPLHRYRRSLMSFLINIVEVSISMTLLGLPSDALSERWNRVWQNIGGAFKLEAPKLHSPYALWFSVETGLLVVFLMACVLGGIQRKEVDTTEVV